jgi:hypothetical protein
LTRTDSPARSKSSTGPSSPLMAPPPLALMNSMLSRLHSAKLPPVSLSLGIKARSSAVTSANEVIRIRPGPIVPLVDAVGNE